MTSYSQLSDFRTCRRLWWYKHRLNLEPKITPVRYALGTAIHAGIEAYYARSHAKKVFADTFLGIWQAEHPSTEIWRDTEWAEAYLLGEAVLSYYCTWASEHDDFSVVATELNLAADLLPGEEPYTGRLDGVARDRHGELWVLEYKTKESFPPQGHLEFDMQSAGYQWLLQCAIENGKLAWAGSDEIVAGTIYTCLRKVVPQPPELLASGNGLSRKQATSTYALWLDAIERYGFAVDAYADKLQALLSQPDPVVLRERHRRDPYEIMRVAEELRLAYTEATNPDVVIYRSPTRWCAHGRAGCPFYRPCVSAWKGGDEEGILDLAYRPRSRREAGNGSLVEEGQT